MEMTVSTISGGETIKTEKTGRRLGKARKLRTAAYIRISFADDVNDGSYEAQEEYFRSLITGSPDMEFAEIYGDYGKSGRFTTTRDGFLSMMHDAKEGKFERLLCKSVSRFARNMGDCVQNIRLLRCYGVTCFFEKEGLDTSDDKSELILSIMAAIAEEESNSSRGNIELARKNRLSEGAPWDQPPYGYRYSKENGTWEIDAHEGEVVRLAFTLALQGRPYSEIRSKVKEADDGQEWKQSRLRNLLTNMKYTGDYITNQTYGIRTEQGIKRKQNKGEVEQFYIEEHHQALVSREVFDLTQVLIKNGLLRSNRGELKTADLELINKGSELAKKM